MDTNPAKPRRLLRRVEAAEYITANYFTCAQQTLAKKAVTGEGPRFKLAGRFPLYSIEHLDEWAKSKISEPVRSTAEALSAADRAA